MPLTEGTLRKILAGAGLTQTIDTDDALYTNGDVICIRAKTAGIKKITAREDFTIENLRDPEILNSKEKTLCLPMKYGETFVGRISR